MTTERRGIGIIVKEELLPCAASSIKTWVNQRVSPFQWLGCMLANYYLQWQRGRLFYLRESLCRREEVLSAPRISMFWKRSLFHVVFWMSSLFLGGAVFVCVGVCFCFASEDIRLFAFHLFSYNLRIVDRPQDVLMTVRASSAHGMG